MTEQHFDLYAYNFLFSFNVFKLVLIKKIKRVYSIERIMEIVMVAI